MCNVTALLRGSIAAFSVRQHFKQRQLIRLPSKISQKRKTLRTSACLSVVPTAEPDSHNRTARSPCLLRLNLGEVPDMERIT